MAAAGGGRTGRGYTTTDCVNASAHQRQNWRQRRADHVDDRLEDAWRAAQPLGWPRDPHNALYARYHPDAGVVLVAQRDTILRVWPVEFFEAEQYQQLVREIHQGIERNCLDQTKFTEEGL